MKLKIAVWIILGIPLSCYGQLKNKNVNENTGRPKLVVAIVVDQMRSDYLYRYYEKYSANGFKRMMREGFTCYNTFYNHMPTHTGPGHASIFTGASPALHGIVANDWLNQHNAAVINCVSDSSEQPLGSDNMQYKRSPKNLQGTGLADELKYAQQFRSKSIGISLKDRGAILPASHSADAAYWFDEKSGNFISSTYYMKQLPTWVNTFNQQKFATKLLQQDWNTYLPIEQYTESSPDDTPYEGIFSFEQKPVFPHRFSLLNPIDFNLINYSPAGNTLTTNFALECLTQEKMGTHGCDFISISYSSTDYIGHMYGIDAIEMEDCMIRLDLELARLFHALDSMYGKNNYLLMLTSDHGAKPNPALLNDHHIPGALFDQKNLMTYCNAFLEKKYGTDGLVLGIMKHMIYLNREKLKQNNIDISEASEALAYYLEQHPQITLALTRNKMSGPLMNFPASLIQQSYVPKRSGDVHIVYNQELLQYQSKGTQHISAYTFDTHVPLLWMGWNIPNGQMHDIIDIKDIAPTLATLLKTSWPSGSNGKVITKLFE